MDKVDEAGRVVITARTVRPGCVRYLIIGPTPTAPVTASLSKSSKLP